MHCMGPPAREHLAQTLVFFFERVICNFTSWQNLPRGPIPSLAGNPDGAVRWETTVRRVKFSSTCEQGSSPYLVCRKVTEKTSALARRPRSLFFFIRLRIQAIKKVLQPSRKTVRSYVRDGRFGGLVEAQAISCSANSPLKQRGTVFSQDGFPVAPRRSSTGRFFSSHRPGLVPISKRLFVQRSPRPFPHETRPMRR